MIFKKYYLAYGSNLNLEQMKYRCPSAKVVGKTKVKDYRLAFKGVYDGYAFLTIEEAVGEDVDVAVYAITCFDEKKLDCYEGYPNSYSKKMLKVCINGKEIEAMIYIMNPRFGYHLPSLRYFTTCYIGFDNFAFNKNSLMNALRYSKEKSQETVTEKIKKLYKKRDQNL